jgi:hypothetical protein
MDQKTMDQKTMDQKTMGQLTVMNHPPTGHGSQPSAFCKRILAIAHLIPISNRYSFVRTRDNPRFLGSKVYTLGLQYPGQSKDQNQRIFPHRQAMTFYHLHLTFAEV